MDEKNEKSRLCISVVISLLRTISALPRPIAGFKTAYFYIGKLLTPIVPLFIKQQNW